jgi:hypothetical protein
MFALNRPSARAFVSQLTIALVALAAPLASSSFGAAGDLYVTDLATGSVIVYAPDGSSTTFTTGLTSPQGITFDRGKNLYVADAGAGQPGDGAIFKYDLATATQTTVLANLDNPIGVTLDGSDLLVAESGAGRVLRVPLDGIHPPTVFRVIASPFDVDSHSFAQAFNRFVSSGEVVLKIAASGDINFDIAGNRGVAAQTMAVNDLPAEVVFLSTGDGTVQRIVNDALDPAPLASGLGDLSGMDFRPARFSGDTEGVGDLYVADRSGQILIVKPNVPVQQFASGGEPNFLIFETAVPTPTPTPTPTSTPTPTPSPSGTPTPTPGATPTPASHPLNISTRVDVETGDNVGIGGFIISGTDPKLVVIRGIGPSLSGVQISNPLSNPILELHDASGLLRTNDNWMDNTPEDQMILTDNNLAPSDDLESAIVMTLEPGPYTAIIKGSNGATGVALVEVYDLDDPSAGGELLNISTRGLAGTGENVLIAGVIVGPAGGGDASVVVRAIGPSLPVANPLIDPVLELRNSNADMIARNDNWETDGPPDNHSAEVTAAMLEPPAAADSAIFANLVPGSYTAIVTGKDGTSGVALVEVYHVPAQMTGSAHP